jgi:hypothetical protein
MAQFSGHKIEAAPSPQAVQLARSLLLRPYNWHDHLSSGHTNGMALSFQGRRAIKVLVLLQINGNSTPDIIVYPLLQHFRNAGECNFL